MYNLDKYSKKFFSMRKSLAWRVPIICDGILALESPKSIVDVGCGNGDLVQGFIDRGVMAIGVEGTQNARLSTAIRCQSNLYILDIRTQPLPVIADLCLCLEVLEHIEPEFAEHVVGNLCHTAPNVYISAAPPGQGGLYHVNCQPSSYWIKLFVKHGFELAPRSVEFLRCAWAAYRNKKGIKAYYNNLLIFRRQD